MQIYIASSWKNQHAVEMLTDMLRDQGHKVSSFVENNFGEGHGHKKPMSFEVWVHPDQARRSFEYDTTWATKSDLIVYLSPSGTDAWAEVGAAWSRGIPILGLWAKGEPAGLMRHMVQWSDNFRELLNAVGEYAAVRGSK